MKDKWKEFVEHYLTYNDAGDAYKSVYTKCNHITALTNSHKLLQKPEIKEYIQQKKKEIADKCTVTKMGIVNTLATIMNDNTARNSDKIKAADTLLKALGYNAPTEQTINMNVEQPLFNDPKMNNFIYTTAIRKMRKMKARIKIIQGGSSSGKTFGIIPLLIDKAIKNPNITISIVSESLPHLRRGAMKDFLLIMRTTNRYIDSHWNRTNSVYTFANGSYIEFFSVEDDAKLRGARRNVLYVNEANNINYPAYTQLAMRTDMDIFLDYNPVGRFWSSEVLEDGDAELLILTYKDNEALNQTVIDFLVNRKEVAKTSTYWENWVRVYVDGQIGQLEGVVFDNWKVVDKIPTDAELICYGVDFGYVNDQTTCVAIYKYNGEILLDELVYQKGLTMSQFAELLREHNVNGTIFADSADPRSIQELRNFGFSTYPTKKGADSILYGISLMHNYQISITKRSTNLKVELENYKWAIDKEGNKLNKPIDAFNHCIDAVRYGFMMRLQRKSSTPMITF